MTAQPLEDGRALKVEAVDTHQWIAHYLSGDGTEKVVRTSTSSWIMDMVAK
jgi:hypothetical protein